MRPKDPDVLIVGSGFSGIVAANVLADHHLDVLLLDENVHVGGQILRSVPERLGTQTAAVSDGVRRAGFRFINNLQRKKVHIMNRAVALGIYPNRELLVEVEGKRVLVLRPKIVLFATGARERFLPFPGWTLPGVISTGAVQILMKSSGVLFSREILIGGAGLFLLAVAHDFQKNGGKVMAVLDETPMTNKLLLLTQLVHHFSKLTQGVGYIAHLALAGVPIRYQTRILEARGDSQLKEVITSKVDRSGSATEGKKKAHETGALAVGYGFCPNIELPQLAGCCIEYDETKGGWVVKVSDQLESTVENVFAAGEITGIAGALKSLNEGRMAAVAILRRLGKIREKDFSPKFKRLAQERRRHLQFGRCFNRLYSVPDEAFRQIPPETIVCRCEDVTVGDVRRAIEQGCHTPGAVKKATRIGMGPCQGRTCGPVLYGLIAAYTRRSPQEIPLLSVRSPTKPVSMSALLTCDVP